MVADALRRTDVRAQSRATPAWRAWAMPLAWFAIHAPLVYAMRFSPLVGVAHFALVMTVGLAIALQWRGSERVAYVAMYIAGAEVLWRMMGVAEHGVFWEAGKYGSSLLFLVAIARSGRLRAPWLPLLYFAALMPSVVPVYVEHGIAEIRRSLSFNLSGPFALLVSAWFFHRLSLGPRDLRALFLAYLGPCCGVAFAALFGIAAAGAIEFSAQSLFQTAGGYGPNQVSAALGLGAVFALAHAQMSARTPAERTGAIAIAVWLFAQSMFTFSRGGVYNTVGAIAVAGLFVLRDPAQALRYALSVATAAIVFMVVVFPALNAYTGGALEARFEDTRGTGREEIARADLEVWRNHFVLGVGPGQSAGQREDAAGAAAHTEYTRLLSEHGVFGLFALLLMLGTAVVAVLRAPPGAPRALTAAMAAWALLFMLHAAMRLVLPSLLLGLCLARVRAEDTRPT
ncbi:MAG TPA: O-antigen ligase family protein [Chthonomonadales bacterium]|nr:O-antigen ligase family protein [Chthonomonadales bacterium]